MRRIASVILALSFATSAVWPQAVEWRAVFAPDNGKRVDFFPKKGGFKHDSDTMSYRYEFIVPASGNEATVRMIPTGKNTVVSEEYPAFIAQRTDDMIVLILVFTARPKPDKFEVYTLYPQAGVGFSSTTSAFVGNAQLKAQSAINPDIPVASALTFPLRRIGK